MNFDGHTPAPWGVLLSGDSITQIQDQFGAKISGKANAKLILMATADFQGIAFAIIRNAPVAAGSGIGTKTISSLVESRNG